MHKLILLFLIINIILINGCNYPKPEIIERSMNKSHCLNYIKHISAEDNLLRIETKSPSQICQNIAKTMKTGDEIRICIHDHGSTKIKVNYVKDSKAQLDIIEIFEHMSFGYNEITQDKCIVNIDKTEFIVD